MNLFNFSVLKILNVIIYFMIINEMNFFVTRSEKTNYYTPVRWNHVFRNYIKKNNEVKDSLYQYIYLYN
jgi:hypothetical protein